MVGQGSPSAASGRPAAEDVAAAAAAVGAIADAVSSVLSPFPCQAGSSESLVGADPWAPQLLLPLLAFAFVAAVAACGAESRW